MTDRASPIRPTDTAARELARALLAGAQFAALATLDPEGGGPLISRIAFGLAPDGTPVSLLSSLAAHTRALLADPRASLLVGEPGGKGDPLTHPRLSLQVTARFVPRDCAAHESLRSHYLAGHPKARLYADFADFSFVRFEVQAAALNGGFGKAFLLGPADLGPET